MSPQTCGARTTCPLSGRTVPLSAPACKLLKKKGRLVLLISRILRLSPWQHPSCLVSFLFIPSLYSLFSITCLNYIPLNWFTVSVKSMCSAVRLRYCAGAVEVRSWYAHGLLLVRSWYAHGSLESSISESVWYGTRFGPLAVGKSTRMHGKLILAHFAHRA